MRKTKKQIIGLAVSSLILLNVQSVEAKKEKNHYFFISPIAVTLRAGTAYGKLDSSSVKVRTFVTSDLYPPDFVGVLEDQKLKGYSGVLGLELETGVGFRKNRRNFEFGGNLEFNIGGPATIERSGKKGYGTAPRYWGFSNDFRDLQFFPGLFTRLSLTQDNPKSLDNSMQVYFKYAAIYDRLYLSKGIDAYNVLHNTDRFRLLDKINHELLLGWGTSMNSEKKYGILFQLEAGASIPQVLREYDMGKFDGKTSLFARYRFDLFRIRK